MAHPPKTILMCSCEDTMRLDTAAVERGCRNERDQRPSGICAVPNSTGSATPPATEAADRRLHAGAPLFRGLRPANVRSGIDFVNIRETAGWSKKARQPGRRWRPCLRPPPRLCRTFPLVTLSSDGVILIYGRDESAIEAGKLLADHLDVTVMITRPPRSRRRRHLISRRQGNDPQRQGLFWRLRTHHRRFCRAPRPPRAMRSIFEPRAMARLRAAISCSISPAARRCFPRTTCATAICAPIRGDPAAMLRAVLKARDLVGSFDKPKYINFTAELCAHSRSKLDRLPPLPRSVPDGRDRA